MLRKSGGKAKVVCLVVLLAAAVLLATTTVLGSAAKLPPIKIGAAGPYTGDVSKIGLDGLNAIKMAVDEANAAGGIGGRMIEIVEADDAGDPSKAILVAEKLAMDRAVIGVVGPMNSATVQAALPTYQRVGLPIISQSATYPNLTEMGYKVMHRICPRDDAQGPASARFIAEALQAKTVYIIDDKTTYGQGLSDQVEPALKAAGVEVLRGQIAIEDRDFSPILTRVKASAPDLVYLGLANPAQAASLIKQAAGLGLQPTFMGGDGLKEKDQLITGAAGLAEGMYVTSIGKDIREVPEAQEFIEKFESKYGAMSVFGGQSYEVANILIDAARRAASDPMKITRANVQEALGKTSSYTGILGFPIGFDGKGDVVGASIFVYQVKDGNFLLVEEYPATITISGQ
ncbi:MAG: branched-chain amino acid ABC transporter substrate-binding protein [Firmicutes bacterium]|nr:branched-chain amino acid ABC transporter substrate-binding protein [Bacillota bacterium]